MACFQQPEGMTHEHDTAPICFDLSAGRMRTGDLCQGLGRRRGHGGGRAGLLDCGDPKDRVASLRGSARGPRHRQQPPGGVPSRRGGGQRRPVRRGELAARVRPLPRRMGQWRAGLRAQLPQADRDDVPHAPDPAGPAAAARDPGPGGPQPGHCRHDQSRRAALGPRLRRVQFARAGDSPWSPGGPFPSRRWAQSRGWDSPIAE